MFCAAQCTRTTIVCVVIQRIGRIDINGQSRSIVFGLCLYGLGDVSQVSGKRSVFPNFGEGGNSMIPADTDIVSG